MSPPSVSIIIVTWNGRELLERFLPSVLSTDYTPLQVVVADNGSTDGTAAWLRRMHPEVDLVEHGENLLFADGNNAAVPYTSGELLCFLNNDVKVEPDWLTPLVSEMSAPSVAAVQPKLLQLHNREHFEYAGASGGFLDAYGIPFTRGRLFTTLERDRGQYDDNADVTWATGAALLVRRTSFEALGGFDERFGMHMEEIDLCWRLWRRGERVRVVPQSQVYHLGGASLPRGEPRKAYYNHRNSLWMLRKNLPAADFRRVMQRRRLMDALATARALASGRFDEARAIHSATRDARSRFKEMGEPPTQKALMPLYHGSIITEYFLRKRRRFQDLPFERFLKPPPFDADATSQSPQN